jgi:hypothetical protein
VILLLLLVALVIALVSREPILAVTGMARAADLFLDVASRVALAVFATLWLLAVRSIVPGRYQDSR